MTDEHRDDNELLRPFGLNLLTGLYLFFFLVTVSTFGNPFPFFGRIYDGNMAKILVFADSIICLYFFLGLLKRQLLTWYFLIGYNLFEIINTIVNLRFISITELERIVGKRIDEHGLVVSNIATALALLLLTQFIYRHKDYFTNKQKYLF